MVRKEKKSKWGAVLVFFIAFIMISSVIGFIWSGSEDNEFKYNDLKFIRTQTGWQARIDDIPLVFDYFPAEVETIELSPEVINALANKPQIDLTSDLDDPFSEEIALAQYNMDLTLRSYNIYLRNGFTTNNTYNMKIITCDDATSSVPVIYFTQSNETKVILDNNCIHVKAKNAFDILRIKDRLLYSLLGIIG